MGPDEVMPSLLSAYPEFQEAWHAYTTSDLHGPGEPYNDIAQLASFLVSRQRASETKGFDRLFEAVECMLRTGPQAVRELLTVGLLEDVQNISLNNSVALPPWEQWLGPTTREAWTKIGEMWNGTLTPEEFNRYVRRGEQ
jgi:hypothetical protein